VIEPLKAEELKSIRELVAGAVGFSASRGDQLIVESLAFEATLRAAPPALPVPPAATGFLQDPKMPFVGAAAGVVVLLLLGAGVLLMIRRKKAGAAKAHAEPQSALPGAAAEALAPGEASAGELPPGQAKTVEDLLNKKESEKERFEAEELAKLQAASLSTTRTEILTRHIGEEAKKSPEAVAQVLRNWLQEE
jgi:flagellar biosynthesis/type III secretory pathway M-ring protein FliF/YscJ